MQDPETLQRRLTLALEHVHELRVRLKQTSDALVHQSKRLAAAQVENDRLRRAADDKAHIWCAGAVTLCVILLIAMLVLQ